MSLVKTHSLFLLGPQIKPVIVACLASIVLAGVLVPVTACKKTAFIRTQKGLNREQVESKNFELFRSAASGNVATTQQALDNGADVNAREEEGETPLMYAAVEGHRDVALLLISRGADVNALSNNHETALGRAAFQGREETVTALISSGANLELGGDYSATPLMLAASQDQIGTMKVLVTKGASVNARDTTGDTALIYAIAGHGSIDTVKLLLEAGADLNTANGKGVTPLTLALERRATEIVDLLKRKGAKR